MVDSQRIEQERKRTIDARIERLRERVRQAASKARDEREFINIMMGILDLLDDEL